MRRGLVLCAVCALVMAIVPAASHATGNVVISQVYGGGGASTGSPTYKYDYIELFNRSPAPQSLNGWSVQYGSAGGTGAWQITALPNVSIPPGKYYLVQEGTAGTTGADLPITPDATGSLNMSATNGKVALVSSTTALVGGNPPGAYVDLVGYGTANAFETTAVGALTNTSGAVRAGDGCTDTDNNSSDFAVVTGTVPRNSASAPHYCGSPTDPSGTLYATPSTLYAGETVVLSIQVVPGVNPPSTTITVTGDLSGLGITEGQLYDDATHGDAVAGDNIFTYQKTMDCSLNTSTSNLTVNLSLTITDQVPRSSTATATVTVRPSTTQLGDSTTFPPDPGNPANAVVCAGDTARFSVRAEGPNLTAGSYTWYRGTYPTGTPLVDGGRISISSPTNYSSVLLISAVDAGDEDTYYAVVQGSCSADVHSTAATLTIGSAPTTEQKQVVISQVYGGGGNTGSTLTHDFIELFNRGPADVNVTGWSVQYASSDTAGSAPNFDSPPRYTILNGTIPAGRYFLIREAQGSGGSIFLADFDVDGTDTATQPQGAIAIGGQGGKIALVTNSTPLSGPCPLSSCALVDFVGWNASVTCHEGAASAPGTGNTSAIIRKSACQDTDQNGDDFYAGTPTPHKGTVENSNPTITRQPANQNVCLGMQATFSVSATGPCLRYKWQVKNGSDWFDVTTGTGIDTFSYTTDPVAAADANRQYRVKVSNDWGPDQFSDPASVLIDPATPDEKQVVISQVYAAGGNTGAVYTNDFVELYNPGPNPVVLDGWSVKYLSTSGSWNTTPLTGSIQPKSFYLVQQAAGTGGTQPLPTPDAIDNVSMSASNATVILIKTLAFLDACPTSDDCRLVDMVGYGGASTTCFKGTGPAPYPTDNTKAIFRLGGCTPQGGSDNQTDFEQLTANPRNSQSVACLCHTPFADADGDGDVDQVDFATFQTCFTGVDGGVPATSAYPCVCFNRDTPTRDNDVDHDDLLKFLNCTVGSGPHIPWTQADNPDCVP
jgi:hypothetical protein